MESEAAHQSQDVLSQGELDFLQGFDLDDPNFLDWPHDDPESLEKSNDAEKDHSEYPDPEELAISTNPYGSIPKEPNRPSGSRNTISIGLTPTQQGPKANRCQSATKSPDPLADAVWHQLPSLSQIPPQATKSIHPTFPEAHKPPVTMHSKPVCKRARHTSEIFESIPEVTSIQDLTTNTPVNSFRAPTAPMVTGSFTQTHANDVAAWIPPTQIGDHRMASERPRPSLETGQNRYVMPFMPPTSSEVGSAQQAIKTCIKKVQIEKAAVSNLKNFRANPVSSKELHPRTRAIQTFDPKRVYDSLPRSYQEWDVFRYTHNGELEPNRYFTVAEIYRYLFLHPLHILPDGTLNPKNGGLRLWIQRNPPDSARRYPNSLSNRCRFEDCFATLNVINQGHLRVCFDEQSSFGLKHDPFLAAGYVHINCLERHLDFPVICANLPIHVDTRHLPLEPGGINRMMLSHDTCIEIALRFIQDCENGALQRYPRGGRPHEGTLVWMLMSEKVRRDVVKLRPRHGTRTGNLENSRMVGHLGDLEVERKTRDKTRKAQFQVCRKRKREEEEEEEEEESESEEEEDESEDEWMNRKSRSERRRALYLE